MSDYTNYVELDITFMNYESMMFDRPIWEKTTYIVLPGECPQHSFSFARSLLSDKRSAEETLTPFAHISKALNKP